MRRAGSSGCGADRPETFGPDATSQVDDRDELWQALGRLPRRQRAVTLGFAGTRFTDPGWLATVREGS
jgi:hypothetical protein